MLFRHVAHQRRSRLMQGQGIGASYNLSSKFQKGMCVAFGTASRGRYEQHVPPLHSLVGSYTRIRAVALRDHLSTRHSKRILAVASSKDSQTFRCGDARSFGRHAFMSHDKSTFQSVGAPFFSFSNQFPAHAKRQAKLAGTRHPRAEKNYTKVYSTWDKRARSSVNLFP